MFNVPKNLSVNETDKRIPSQRWASKQNEMKGREREKREKETTKWRKIGEKPKPKPNTKWVAANADEPSATWLSMTCFQTV